MDYTMTDDFNRILEVQQSKDTALILYNTIGSL